jgi:3-hydroxyisobutyrate dehydrogenase-like beta-hydroxyacid dehydrogenase
VADARVVLSLVTADQALLAAKAAATHLEIGALYFDMNSVAPDTKRAAARAVEAVGGCYIDVAVMAPVDTARLAVPLLVSGPHAEVGAFMLEELGFSKVDVLRGNVGRASSVKMIRSVMIKGIEALTAEMVMAGDAAGVLPEVLASLGSDWPTKAAYNIERMKTHGQRRAAEMEEVARTLVALGVDPVMTRGTVARQREMACDAPCTAREALNA